MSQVVTEGVGGGYRQTVRMEDGSTQTDYDIGYDRQHTPTHRQTHTQTDRHAATSHREASQYITHTHTCTHT